MPRQGYLVGIAMAMLTAATGAQPLPAATPPLSDSAVQIRNVTYADIDGSATEATLVLPASATGTRPAVVFAHWYGPESTNSNRTQFLPDALALARTGIVSLLIDTPWSNGDWFVRRDPGRETTLAEDATRRMRRSIEVLASIDKVDVSRLAFVGHDFGAMFGAAAAAFDGRVHTFVFIAGTARMGDWFTLGRQLDAAGRENVLAALSGYDPVRHLPRAAAGPILLQFATRDRYVSRATADQLAAAASSKGTVQFYDAEHGMNSEAMHARVAWLTDALAKRAGTGR